MKNFRDQMRCKVYPQMFTMRLGGEIVMEEDIAARWRVPMAWQQMIREIKEEHWRQARQPRMDPWLDE